MPSVFDQLNWSIDTDATTLLQLVSTQVDAQDELRKRIRHHLARDYPAAALSWLPTVTWSPPTLVPLSSFDLRGIEKWPTWQDKAKIKAFTEKIESGWHKSIVAIKVPGARYLLPIDGHTRLSVYWKLKRPVLAWVGKAHSQHGPWDTFHSQQRGMSAHQKEAGFASDAEPLSDERYCELLELRRTAREQFPPGHTQRVEAERSVRQARKLRSEQEDEPSGEASPARRSVSSVLGSTHTELLLARREAQLAFPAGHPQRVKAERAVRQSRLAARRVTTPGK